MMLDGNLRKQQPALGVKLDQKPMMSNFNGLGSNGLGRRKKGNLDTKRIKLFGAHGNKPRVLESGARGATDDGLSQRFVWLDDPDAALQTPANVQRHENPPPLRENPFL